MADVRRTTHGFAKCGVPVKKDVLIAVIVAAILVALITGLLVEAIRGNADDSFARVLRETWQESKTLSIGALLFRLIVSYAFIGIGVLILCFAEIGAIAMLLFLGLGLGLMACSVSALLTHSILVGIGATLLSGGYLILMMFIVVVRIRAYGKAHND